MQDEHSKESSFFGMIYEELIPADHLLYKLAAAVDLSFVSETVGDWGLAKVGIQVLMTCIVVNCKKIAKLVSNRLSKLPTRPCTRRSPIAVLFWPKVATFLAATTPSRPISPGLTSWTTPACWPSSLAGFDPCAG